MDKQEDLTKGKISKHLRRIAIPASIGFFFNTMYNVVDTFWAGQLSTNGLAALALSFPVFFLIIAFGSGFASGTTALIGNNLGEKKKKEAKLIFTQAIGFGVFFSIILSIVGLIISPTLFKFLGATDEFLHYSLDYMNIIFYGGIFFMVSQILNAGLIATGDTKTYRNILIAGFFLNLLLDPMLMYGWFGLPELGIKGIALATIIIQGVSTIYIAYRVYKSNLLPKRFMKRAIPDRKSWLDIMKQGFPASLNMLTIALGIFVINFFLKDFGKDAIAAYGTAIRVEQIALLPSIGLNIAALSIVGQCNGAKKFKRIKETLRLTIRYGSYMMLVIMPFVFIFAKPLNGLFTDDQNVIKLGTDYLRISVFASIGYIILFQTTSVLQGMKKPTFALWIGLYRQLIGAFAIFFLLTEVFDLGVKGVWWGLFVLVWSSVIIAYWYLNRVFKGLRLKRS